LAFALFVVLSGCTTHVQGKPPRSTTSVPTTSVPTQSSVPQIASTYDAIPRTYKEACSIEGSVCEKNTPGKVPPALDRAIHLPVVSAGQQCPVTMGAMVNTSSFSGVALGPGPVQVIPSQNNGDLVHGSVALKGSDTPGWLAFKTLWFSSPPYQGPFLVRGESLDGGGPVAVLDGAVPGALVFPPAPSLNGSAGYRVAPEGTYVKAPGCYGFQIDGTTFSETVVIDAVSS
jgi:hypothetical protein